MPTEGMKIRESLNGGVAGDTAAPARGRGPAPVEQLAAALLRRHRPQNPHRRRLALSRQPHSAGGAGKAFCQRAAQGRRRADLSRHSGREGRRGRRGCAVSGGGYGGEGSRQRSGADLHDERWGYRRLRAALSAALCAPGARRRLQALRAGARPARGAAHACACVRSRRACRRGDPRRPARGGRVERRRVLSDRTPAESGFSAA